MKERTFHLKTTVVADEENKHCYEITRELEGESGDHVFLVTLYPSYSASTQNLYIDSTGNSLINHMYQMGISKVTMVFLFTEKTMGAKKSTKSLKDNTDGIEYFEELLKNPMNKRAKVIIALGGSMMKNKVAIRTRNLLFTMLKKYRKELYQLSNSRVEVCSPFGIHPLFLSCRAKNLPWELSRFPYPDERLKTEKIQRGKPEVVDADVYDNGFRIEE